MARIRTTYWNDDKLTPEQVYRARQAHAFGCVTSSEIREWARISYQRTMLILYGVKR